MGKYDIVIKTRIKWTVSNQTMKEIFFKNRIFDKDKDSMNIVESNPDGDISRKIGYFGKNQS